MYRKSSLTLIPLLILGLYGCGGGSGGADETNTTDDTNTDAAEATATLTGANALAAAREATRGAGGAGIAGNTLSDTSAAFSDITDESNSKTLAGVATGNTVACPDGGTLEYSAIDSSIAYSAIDCDTGAGDPFNGEIILTVGQWDEYPDGGLESLIEIEGAFTGGDGCRFEGAFGWRVYSEMPDTLPDGDYLFVYEYGTDSGFSAACNTGADFSLAADTSVRNTLAYTISGSQLDSYSNVVTAGGSFESPDGDGTLLFSADDLSYPIDSDNESLYGDPRNVCPSGGSITVSGTGDTQVTVYFGEDAPDPYTVQVTGPDGYVGEFETCDGFLSQ